MNTSPAQRLPRWLLLAISVIVIADALQVIGTLANPAPYLQFTMPFPAIAVIAIAGGWGILLAYLLLDLLRRRQWAYRWLSLLLSVYALTQFLWQFAFFRSDYDRGRLAFQAVINLVALIPIWWLIWRQGWLKRR